MTEFFLKTAGAVLVFAGASGLGYWYASRLRERVACLETVRRMVFLLKGEILYAGASLEEAFEQVGKREEGEVSELFCGVSERLSKKQGESFYSMWEEEVDKLSPAVPLSREDRRELRQFGKHLGYLDRQMQERTLLLYLDQLELSIGQLRESQKEKSRLCVSLGMAGGLFFIIIMC